MTILEGEFEIVKEKLDMKVEDRRVACLESSIEDLQNRSRRCNVVLHNIPEGSEGDLPWEEFVSKFLTDHMKLESGIDIEIDKAHRTGQRRWDSRSSEGDHQYGRHGSTRSRPIHVKLLRYADKVTILRNASKQLKNNPFKGSLIFSSDDVTNRVRQQRKLLREKHLPGLRKDTRIKFAYIPWSVPAVIRYQLVSGEFKTCSMVESKKD